MSKIRIDSGKVGFSIVQLSFVVLFLFGIIEMSYSFYCTESFCEEYTASYNKPCPAITNNCTKTGYRKYLDPEVCNCCEYCFDYLKEGDTCTTASHEKPSEMCGPQLKCVLEDIESDNGKCRKITGQEDEYGANFCMRIRHNYEQDEEAGTVGVAQMKPECDAVGNYAPRQCLKGSVCYCSNWKGERIFGLARPDEYQDCACARDVDRLKEFGFTGRFPHCLPNGDYDELQCVVRDCFCRSHPEELFAIHALNTSTCYNPEIHVFEPERPRYYVRDCELHLARIEVQIADAEMKGIKRIVADKPKCDPDGNYAPIQSDFNKLYCAAQNGTRIDNYEAEKFSSEAVQMNCYCARAQLLLSDTATSKPKCCGNGNYKPWQCIGSRCFCVDRLGRQDKTKGEVDEDHAPELDCYPGNKRPEDGREPECNYEYEY